MIENQIHFASIIFNQILKLLPEANFFAVVEMGFNAVFFEIKKKWTTLRR